MEFSYLRQNSRGLFLKGQEPKETRNPLFFPNCHPPSTNLYRKPRNMPLSRASKVSWSNRQLPINNRQMTRKFMLKLLHVLLSYLRLKFRNMIGSGLMTCDTLYVVIQDSVLFYMNLEKHHNAVIWKLYKIFSLHILIAISEISR